MTNAPYAGDLIADEALKLLTENSNAVLIDVRTDNEHTNIGIPDLSGLDKQPQLISWQLSPTMEINENFIAIMKDLGTEADAPLIFLCRSGVRSVNAATAIAAEGFSNCYNVLGGFEGNPEGPIATTVKGWKAAGLPCTFPKSYIT